MKIELSKVVGKGYKEFWNCKKRYRVIKGSRASKKSKTCALNFIYRMMKYPQANLLVIRKNYRTLKDSCFAELRWAIDRLKVNSLWDYRLNPLELTYKPTGQKIYFRGMDDPLKITSITVTVGVLCWMWIEEAYEITKEDAFDILDESIRGETPEGLFKQATLSFNPWNERHWLKKRFFDTPNDDVLALTTNYMCNEWLDEADKKLFEEMKVRNPRRYQVAGLGNWGIVDGLIYENWKEQEFTLKDVEGLPCETGVDFGWVDPFAMVVCFVDLNGHKIYVWDEIYKTGLSNKKAFDLINEMGYGKNHIVADCAEPKSIDELAGYGLRIKAARKGADSIINGIKWLQDFEFIIHPRCNNFITEISNYSWDKDKFGKTLERPIDDFNHLLDAMRYGVEKYVRERKWIY